VGLASVALLVFVSVSAAHYRHPALLVAWEWLILVLAFFLVRQLARDEASCRGLLAVVVATGVSLAAQAVYQSAYELPSIRAELSDPTAIRAAVRKLNIVLEPDDQRIEFWRKRIQMDHAFATFAHPNGFAGYLALLVPIGLGWTLGHGK